MLLAARTGTVAKLSQCPDAASGFVPCKKEMGTLLGTGDISHGRYAATAIVKVMIT